MLLARGFAVVDQTKLCGRILDTLVREFQADIRPLGASVVVLLSLVLVGEILLRVGATPQISRSVVHCGVGLYIAQLPELFRYPTGVYLVAIVFVVGNYIAWRRKWWSGIHAARKESVGTITFPLALIPALLVTWSTDVGRLFAFKTAILILAISDPLAALVGGSFPSPMNFYVDGSRKSVVGTAAFFSSALLITMYGLQQNSTRIISSTLWATEDLLACSLIGAWTTTVVELLGKKGWDNFYIVVAGVSSLVFVTEHMEYKRQLLAAIALGTAFILWKVYRFTATQSEAIVGGLFVAQLASFGGWVWSIAAFKFVEIVVLQPLLSIGRDSMSVTADFIYGSLAIPAIILLINAVWPHELLFWGFIGSFATIVVGDCLSVRSWDNVPKFSSGRFIRTAGELLLLGFTGAYYAQLSSWEHIFLWFATLMVLGVFAALVPLPLARVLSLAGRYSTVAPLVGAVLFSVLVFLSP
eukprot:gb/GECG01000323.1/.p1 GENE.gb/GECG01000323.1/~~gb/GECG01000323.1/.p1  ORF type:complete len:471 (+),score=25.49 gb/GECG01000323.1/:1-1413(+)